MTATLTAHQRSLLEEALYNVDGLADEDVYKGYSGRAMYGSTCFGLTLNDERQYGRFLVELATTDHDLAIDLAERVTTDQLGLGQIFYFPGLDWSESA